MPDINWTQKSKTCRNATGKDLCGDFEYWEVFNRQTNRWNIEDNFGAVWGAFKTADEAKAGVAKHVTRAYPQGWKGEAK